MVPIADPDKHLLCPSRERRGGVIDRGVFHEMWDELDAACTTSPCVNKGPVLLPRYHVEHRTLGLS